jgi:hypothetical protein
VTQLERRAPLGWQMEALLTFLLTLLAEDIEELKGVRG